MPIRLRIRGPEGQSTASLDDNATIATLKSQISELTKLSAFDVKCSYPPKPLKLDEYADNTMLSKLGIKLNGEQLLVTRADGATSASPAQRIQPEIPAQANSTCSQPTNKLSAKTSAQSQPTRQPDAPLALARKQRKNMDDPPEVFVPDLGGTLVLRVMPDDNSCLFRAISLAVLSDLDAVTELRSIIAETIQADPLTFNKAVLDNKDPDKYCQWIKSQDSWGGQVELMILAQHFGVEICSIDVQSLRVDRYNEGANKRCFVVYSGIHYDTIALSFPGMPPENDLKQFEDFIKEEVMPRALELCKKLQEQHYFTDTSGFQLICNDCGTRLVGEKGAQTHAAATGHFNFGEA